MRTRTIVLLAAVLLPTTITAAAELTGQIVCSECWFEADRNRVAYGTPADMDCARRCAEKGQPAALAVKGEGLFKLVLLEGDRDWLEWIARFARVRGETEERDGKRFMRVESIEALDENPWPAVADETAEAEFAWTDLAGHSQTLEALHGRIVVLNFWATWCEPCRKEMPDLVRIQNRFGMYGVQVVGASADPATAAPTVIEFARKHRINFPMLLGATTPQMQSLGLGVALPGTVVIDRHGQVVEQIPGVVDPERLEALLEQLVHEKHSGRLERHGVVKVAAARAGHGDHASLVPS